MKVVMYPAITLDGFISDLDGECDSWLNEADEKAYNDAIAEAGCVLMGRKTYEQYIDDFPPDRKAVTFVYTSHTDQKDEGNIKFVRGTPAEVIKQIADQGFSKLVVSGGGEVNGALAEAGLIDEIVIAIYNLTLGEGIPLFGSHKPKLNLKLLSTSQKIEGIMTNHYRVVK